MNKDAILASGIGFGVGLLITGGILLGPTLLSQITSKTQEVRNQVQSPQVQPQKNNDAQVAGDQTTSFSIDSHQSETIVDSDKISINGKAKDGTFVVIAGDLEEQAAVASGNTYSIPVLLKEGKNDITVTNIDGDQATVQKLTLYYTPKS